ncbi:MAG TPA: hypothetical protein VJT73_15585 [Polyangiaceae bacterium]|nr:hypothetical protein [Polyangiaceae bacterium]
MVIRTTSTGLAVVLLVTLAACKPEFDERTSLVRDERILAVRSAPAEAQPLDPALPGYVPLAYTALVADKDGTKSNVPIEWAYCTLPKPVSELNDVNQLCFSSRTAPYLKPFAMTGTSVSADLPWDTTQGENGCNQFGPDVPATGRPADPDSTGGYYQPVRLIVDRGGRFDLELAETRIKCNLPGATPSVFGEYENRYRLNQNPELDTLVASSDPTLALKTEEEGDSGLVVGVGAAVSLTASWAACPTTPECGNGFCEEREDKTACPADCTTPKGCTGSEPYVHFDLTTRTVVPRREAMRLSWYTTAGTLRDDRTGSTEEDVVARNSSSSENVWSAPTTPQTATLWVVLRDSRGGSSWKAYRVTVQ